MTQEIEIKITGSGTANNVVAALRQVAKEIEDGDHVKTLAERGEVEWEDETLMTVITDYEEETDDDIKNNELLMYQYILDSYTAGKTNRVTNLIKTLNVTQKLAFIGYMGAHANDEQKAYITNYLIGTGNQPINF